MKLQVLLVSLVALALGQIPDEDWGYVDVRPGAHMFWWLYGSYQTPREKQPLILWLQGGPGGSSTGFGNFGELGPLDVNLQPRNTSWVYAANVLFIDNPVGTGYSYVDSADKYTTNNDQIAADLVSIFSAFLDAYPVFKTIPFYVFCESYGGKMTTGFANALLDAIHTGKVSSNFSGIALGDSWISPIDYVNTWGPLLYSMSLVDKHQLDRINVAAAATQQAVDNGQWNNATDLWSNVENVVEAVSANTDFYNILSRELPNQSLRRVKFAHPGESSIDSLRRIHLDPINQEDPLDKLMNTVIRQKLNGNPKKGKVIPDSVNWGAQAGNVFSALSGDFMRPVVTGDGSVDKLLQQNFPVTVYTGQLDLICCTLGTDLWMHRLTWGGMPNFFESPKIEHDMPNQPGVLGGFSKSYRNLRMWYIMMAGHMVPADNGPMALAMVRAITGGKQKRQPRTVGLHSPVPNICNPCPVTCPCFPQTKQKKHRKGQHLPAAIRDTPPVTRTNKQTEQMDTYTQGFDFIFKTIVIGDSGVGKTCLLERLVDDRFMEDFVSTIGVDFKLHVLQVDGKKVKLQIWDSAGQERFRGITRSFYRGANGVVICFDITRRESFDSLPSWIDEVTRLVTPGTPFVLVGCKGDMHPRGVTAEEAQAYAAKLQTVYVETSSKTRANVDQAFDFIVKRILQNAYQRAPPATNNGSVSLSGGGKVDQPKKNCCG